MPSKLAQIWFAAVLASAGSPALAAGMPDIGTKNFVPGSDAPAYLTNENLAVPPGSPGQSPIGTAYNQTAGPPLVAAAPARGAQAQSRSHARFAAARPNSHHAAVSSASKRRASYTSGRPAAGKRRSASRSGMARATRSARATAATARTAAAKRGRASTRHAAARSAARRG